MATVELKMNLDDLKEGMVLSQDVINKAGVTLLSKGFKIKDILKVKNILNVYNISEIKVNIDIDDNNEDISFLQDYKEISEFKENVDIFIDDLKKGFKHIERGETIDKEFEDKIKDTLKSCKGRINVFQLMEKIKDIDDYIYIHCYNVTLISYSIGMWIGLKDDELRDLTLGSMLCDLGKIKISPQLLNKKEMLNDREFDELKKHVVYSHELILKNKYISKKVKDAVFFHHERIDGSGYPKGLRGDDIPLFAKIIAIADVYNALTSNRPYRDKKTPFEAVKILEKEYIDKLDTKILYVFLNKVAGSFVGNKVRLSDGRIAEISFIPKQNIYRPIVKIESTKEVLDLADKKNKNINIDLFL